MRRFFVILLLLLWGVISIHAETQDDDVYLMYYEDITPNKLDLVLLWDKICPEAILKLNPDFDINQVSYGDSYYIPKDTRNCYGNNQLPTGYERLKYYEDGQWLDEPYYSDEVVYLFHSSIEEIAQEFNVCVDDLLADNILLHDFDAYRKFVNYSMDVFIPKDAPPCDADFEEPTPPNILTESIHARYFEPLYYTRHYNVCLEELRFSNNNPFFYTWLYVETDIVNTYIREDHRPCYNEQGQRLIYVDEMGNLLETPHYTDLAVYITEKDETLPEIAEKMGVCLVDLVRINNFPNMPLIVSVELFIPPARPCPDDIETHFVRRDFSRLDNVAISLNICPEILAQHNAYITYNGRYWQSRQRFIHHHNYDLPVIVPVETTPCYGEYNNIDSKSWHAIEQEINVCKEEFIPIKEMIYFQLDSLPCYNELGHRLSYQDYTLSTPRQRPNADTMPYRILNIHQMNNQETLYDVSRQYNVCIMDILAFNVFFHNKEIYVPVARPCYDEETGRQLIYEDSDGNPLNPPQLSENLIHYGSDFSAILSRIYNVCINRIEDANRAKLDREASYLGWIIPTDRPPCYDETGTQIHYACYDQALDFNVDYRQHNPPIRLNRDGTHCYNLADPQTIVWHDNAPYQIINYQNTLLQSRAFTAWCYGVEEAEIDAINAEPAILAILQLRERAIPIPTRACYLDHPEILEGKTIHYVASGETLHSIAQQYNMPYQWIARANNLNEQNMIWNAWGRGGQQALIIPDGLRLQDIYRFVIGVLVIDCVVIVWLFIRKKRCVKSASLR